MEDKTQVFKLELVPVPELPDGAMDLYNFNPVGERKIVDGRVTESSRIIYSLSEQDIITVVEEREFEFTPKQLDQVVGVFQKNFSASCGWHDVVCETLDELGFQE